MLCDVEVILLYMGGVILLYMGGRSRIIIGDRPCVFVGGNCREVPFVCVRACVCVRAEGESVQGLGIRV